MKWIKNFILWLWQFPQNYLAFLVYGCLGPPCYYGGKYEGKNVIYSTYIPSSFSLGDYIFMVPDFPKESFKHELGHCYQSQLLGWLYIPVIAIPSVLHNLYVRIVRKLGYKPDYYSFYTEKWADHLVEKIG